MLHESEEACGGHSGGEMASIDLKNGLGSELNANNLWYLCWSNPRV